MASRDEDPAQQPAAKRPRRQGGAAAPAPGVPPPATATTTAQGTSGVEGHGCGEHSQVAQDGAPVPLPRVNIDAPVQDGARQELRRRKAGAVLDFAGAPLQGQTYLPLPFIAAHFAGMAFPLLLAAELHMDGQLLTSSCTVRVARVEREAGRQLRHLLSGFVCALPRDLQDVRLQRVEVVRREPAPHDDAAAAALIVAAAVVAAAAAAASPDSTTSTTTTCALPAGDALSRERARSTAASPTPTVITSATTASGATSAPAQRNTPRAPHSPAAIALRITMTSRGKWHVPSAPPPRVAFCAPQPPPPTQQPGPALPGHEAGAPAAQAASEQRAAAEMVMAAAAAGPWSADASFLCDAELDDSEALAELEDFIVSPRAQSPEPRQQEQQQQQQQQQQQAEGAGDDSLGASSPQLQQQGREGGARAHSLEPPPNPPQQSEGEVRAPTHADQPPPPQPAGEPAAAPASGSGGQEQALSLAADEVVRALLAALDGDPALPADPPAAPAAVGGPLQPQLPLQRAPAAAAQPVKLSRVASDRVHLPARLYWRHFRNEAFPLPVLVQARLNGELVQQGRPLPARIVCYHVRGGHCNYWVVGITPQLKACTERAHKWNDLRAGDVAVLIPPLGEAPPLLSVSLHAVLA